MSITNKWEEEEYLSRGAYSEVFRVRLHGKDYALKKIFPHLLKEPIHRESVEREIKILESIQHPKIIKFYQTIVQEEEISLLMEYASGGSLYDQLKLYRKLPEKQVKRYICDITEALEYLHSKDCPILHRDIKPQNLLIDGQGNCKLADFGSSNKMDGVRKSYVGTPEYMPPEIAQFKPHGIKADLWNLGMLIYQLLTGNTPNPANMSCIEYPAFLSRSAEDVIKKLLVTDPVKRISISQLRQHIWLYEVLEKPTKLRTSETENKFDQLRDNIKFRLSNFQFSGYKPNQQSVVFHKERSVFEENEDITREASSHIELLKEKEKLKEQFKLNEKRIERQEMRKRQERPYLLQEIDRVKLQIKEYDKDIAILRARPLKMEGKCRYSILLLGKKVEELTEYIQSLSSRTHDEIMHMSDYEASAETLPISEYIFTLKLRLLCSHRDSIISYIAAKKTHNQILQMTQMQTELSGMTTIQQDVHSMTSFSSMPSSMKLV